MASLGEHHDDCGHPQKICTCRSIYIAECSRLRGEREELIAYSTEWRNRAEILDSEQQRIDDLEAECDAQRTMIDGCRARLENLVSSYHELDHAEQEYFSEYGAEHLEDCPEDDTCECPLVQAWTKADGAMSRSIELAERRITKIDTVKWKGDASHETNKP